MMAARTVSPGPLSGVRVLDIADMLAAEYGARILAELGADVIKVEPPPDGGHLRRIARPGHRLEHLFPLANAGKRSICLDLQNPRSTSVFSDLVSWANVLIESDVAGSEEPSLPAPERADTWNPGLITCSISAFGRATGRRMRLGSAETMDFIMQALCGTAYVTGDPDGPPRLNATGYTHTTTGVHAGIAIIHALLTRRGSGQGQHIDLAVLDTALAMDAEHASLVAAERGHYQAVRTGHVGDVDTLALYRAKDGYVVIEVWGQGPSSLWGRLALAMGREDLLDDARFRDDQARMANFGDLHPIVEGWIGSFPSAQAAVDYVMAAKIVAGRVLLPWETAEHPQVKARGIIELVETPDGKVPLARATPYKLAGLELHVGAPPRLGEHGEQILKEVLGYHDKEVSDLRNERVIYETVTS
jgi:CoA:oxalate CoA-transferase